MADPITGKPGEGTPLSQAPAADPTAGSKVEYSPEQQAHLEEILKREKRSWEKEVEPLRTKAAEFDKYQAKQKEQEEAAKSELQKLQEDKTRLTAEAEYGKRLQEVIAKILAAKLETIPEDKRSLVEGLPENMTPEDKLQWIEKNAAILYGKAAAEVFAPPGGKPAGGKADPDRTRAESIVQRSYGPKDPIWKDAARLEAKIVETIEQIKKQAKPVASAS